MANFQKFQSNSGVIPLGTLSSIFKTVDRVKNTMVCDGYSIPIAKNHQKEVVKRSTWVVLEYTKDGETRYCCKPPIESGDYGVED